ncbi:hypothetical protein [Halopiger goleimassiliensis]|uniref:hypothetical protein n=1 Tax=Halopiger goleimassiliensis TaxID=1293048 RepID=UPI0006780F04|nr:hypothetical protein [Halopiger goleimassiliensis]
MNRRTLLLGSGVALTSVLAGCAGGEDGNGNGTGNGDGNGTGSGNGDSTDESESDEPEPETNAETDDEPETDDGESERSDADELLSITDTLDGDEPLFDSGTAAFDGSGDSVTDEFDLDSGLTVVAFDYDDGGSFENYQLELVGGPTDELLVNALEPVSGAVALPTQSGEYLFDVTAPADWELHVGQPEAPPAEIRTPDVTASGDGPAVVGPIELEGGVTVSGEHEGENNFIVNAFAEDDSATFLDGELVFNEIGEYEGETRIEYDGVCWIDVDASGAWRLEIES